jgi:hypothetical protein
MRCPNGSRKNKKTGNCEANRIKTKRCPNGTKRNKKTGNCESTKIEKLFQISPIAFDTKMTTPLRKSTSIKQTKWKYSNGTYGGKKHYDFTFNKESFVIRFWEKRGLVEISNHGYDMIFIEIINSPSKSLLEIFQTVNFMLLNGELEYYYNENTVNQYNNFLNTEYGKYGNIEFVPLVPITEDNINNKINTKSIKDIIHEISEEPIPIFK